MANTNSAYRGKLRRKAITLLHQASTMVRAVQEQEPNPIEVDDILDELHCSLDSLANAVSDWEMENEEVE